MPAKKYDQTAPVKILWGDRTLQAAEFADVAPAHRTPDANDPEWNEMVDELQGHDNTNHLQRYFSGWNFVSSTLVAADQNVDGDADVILASATLGVITGQQAVFFIEGGFNYRAGTITTDKILQAWWETEIDGTPAQRSDKFPITVRSAQTWKEPFLMGRPVRAADIGFWTNPRTDSSIVWRLKGRKSDAGADTIIVSNVYMGLTRVSADVP